MGKWEDYVFRRTLLEEFQDSRAMPDAEEWEIIYQCTKDGESDNRYDAAEVLGIRCNGQDEERLRQMSYDKNELVALYAIEALENGEQETTLRRLYKIMRTGGTMLRGYAVGSFLDVWINRYGYTKPSVKKCWRKMEKLYKKEKCTWVLIAYENARYVCGCERGLIGLRDILYKEREQMAFSQLRNVRTVFNQRKINEILKTAAEYVGDSPGFREDIKEFIEQKELPGILIIDRENAGLSQMMDYLSYKMEDEIWVQSAGINPEDEIMDEVREKLGEEEKMKRYYYPKKIRSVWIYDFIVPLGIRLKLEDYPFQRIVPLFEDVDERLLDVARAEKMLEELRDYIYKEIERVR